MKIPEQNKKGVLNMHRRYSYLHGHTFSFNALNVHWRALKWGTFLMLACAFDAYAISSDELKKCLKEYELTECQVMIKLKKLSRLQHATNEKVKSELLQCTPMTVGYDYKKALVNYQESQKAWGKFLEKNCSLVADTFGQGTARGVTTAFCEIELHEQNLKRTNKFLQSLRDTRKLALGYNKTEQFKDSPAIICK